MESWSDGFLGHGRTSFRNGFATPATVPIFALSLFCKVPGMLWVRILMQGSGLLKSCDVTPKQSISVICLTCILL